MQNYYSISTTIAKPVMFNNHPKNKYDSTKYKSIFTAHNPHRQSSADLLYVEFILYETAETLPRSQLELHQPILLRIFLLFSLKIVILMLKGDQRYVHLNFRKDTI